MLSLLPSLLPCFRTCFLRLISTLELAESYRWPRASPRYSRNRAQNDQKDDPVPFFLTKDGEPRRSNDVYDWYSHSLLILELFAKQFLHQRCANVALNSMLQVAYKASLLFRGRKGATFWWFRSSANFFALPRHTWFALSRPAKRRHKHVVHQLKRQVSFGLFVVG